MTPEVVRIVNKINKGYNFEFTTAVIMKDAVVIIIRSVGLSRTGFADFSFSDGHKSEYARRAIDEPVSAPVSVLNGAQSGIIPISVPATSMKMVDMKIIRKMPYILSGSFAYLPLNFARM